MRWRELVLVGLMALIAACADDGEKTSSSPAGAAETPAPLVITEPADGAVVNTKEVFVRGTAPANAEVRRDAPGLDPKVKANAEGQWEHKVTIDEAGKPQQLKYFLQEWSDSKDEELKKRRVTVTVTYDPAAAALTGAGAPPVPLATTETRTAMPTAMSTAMLTATRTPSPAAAAATAAPSPTRTSTASATGPPPPTTVRPASPTATAAVAATARGNCHPSYPDVCIPPPPPDLDCADIPYRGFRVLPPDPHRLDGMPANGIGCETPR